MAPNTSLVVRPASSMARRAASAAIMRSDRSGCCPATTPSPIMAYLPDDGCFGTRASSVALAPAHARTGTGRQLEHSAFDFQALERIVEQPIELTELTGIIDTRQRTRKMERLCRQQPAADRGTETVADTGGFAEPRRRQRVAQTAELGNLEAHRIDDLA